ncbi:MAG TPA: DUF4174 domain-containing protein [Longimicrobiaceae bacterium]|nr:DUF4174 domain-containing protein [Longimicrobiaceae bacterium]
MISSQTHTRYEGSKHLFLLFTPSEEDDRFDGQLLCMNDYKEGFIERDLVLFEVIGDGGSRAAGEPLSEVEAESLRKRFSVGEEDFLSVLIGKDGIEQARWQAPVPPGELFRTVDAMHSRDEGLRAQNHEPA